MLLLIRILKRAFLCYCSLALIQSIRLANLKKGKIWGSEKRFLEFLKRDVF